MAHGPLKQRPAEQGRPHETGHVGIAQTRPLRKGRAHTEKGTGEHAGCGHAHDAQRRDLKQAAQTEARRGFDIGFVLRAQGDGQQRNRKHNGHQGEGNETHFVADQNQPLPHRTGHRAHDHVGTKHLATVLARCGRVQPTLNDHVHADDTQAGQQTQTTPKPRVDPHGVQDGHRRGHGGQGGKGPDVADAANQPRGRIRAHQEADVIRRHHQTQRHTGEVGQVCADAHHREQQADPDHDQGHRRQQRRQRHQNLAQRGAWLRGPQFHEWGFETKTNDGRRGAAPVGPAIESSSNEAKGVRSKPVRRSPMHPLASKRRRASQRGQRL